MATVSHVILKQQQKEDGTFNVKIRITHNRKSSYIATPHYVDASFFRKNGELKKRNNFIYDEVLLDVLRIRKMFSGLGHSIGNYTAKELAKKADDLLSGRNLDQINFFDYGYKVVGDLKNSGRPSYENMEVGLRRFESFIKSRDLNFSDITSNLLRRYEEWLRQQPSLNSKGKGVTISSAGVKLYIGNIQRIFNIAKEEFNDEDRGIIRIANNPFSKYKLPKYNAPSKYALSRDQIRAIASCRFEAGCPGRIIARDVFIMSFLLVGMNTADLYHLLPESHGRFNYERRKTTSKRADKAFFSVKIEPELLPYLERYKDLLGDRTFNFFTRYVSHDQFNHKLNMNIKACGEMIGVPEINMYFARRSWATIARNECGVSMDDIAFCLNHKSGHDMTEVYVAKDWEIVDRANRKVIDYVFGGSVK